MRICQILAGDSLQEHKEKGKEVACWRFMINCGIWARSMCGTIEQLRSSDKELRPAEVNNPSSAVASLTASLSVRLTTSMSHSGEQPVRSPPCPPFLTFKAAANPPSLASPPHRRFPLLLLLEDCDLTSGEWAKQAFLAVLRGVALVF